MKEYYKQYKVVGKPKNEKQWLTVIFRFYPTFEDAKEAMEIWEKLRKSKGKDVDWEYKILVQEVTKWEEVE